MNCVIIDDEELSRKSLEMFIVKTDFLSLMESFSDPIIAISYLNDYKIDLVFVDIEMPGMTGLELIDAIKHLPTQVIITTSHKEFALDAFEFYVTDYLVKPITYSRFYKAVFKVKELHEKKAMAHDESDILFVKKGSVMMRIKKSEILWVEALGDYVTLNTEKEKYIVHSTMKAIEHILPSLHYMRVHRSYIVRIDKIDSIEEYSIAYKNKLIPIGKSYRNVVFKRLNVI
jgi:DNA-binding LytR/AlgR family response regulator